MCISWKMEVNPTVCKCTNMKKLFGGLFFLSIITLFTNVKRFDLYIKPSLGCSNI